MKSILVLLNEMFGFPRHYSANSVELEYICPHKTCDAGKTRKYNLQVNIQKNVFHCWACGYKGYGVVEGINGKLPKLINDWATDSQKQYFKVNVEPSLSNLKFKEKEKPVISELYVGSFRSLSVPWEDSIHWRAVSNYIRSRGITQHLIEKWDICYSESGPYKHRVIIPYKAESGKIEYFVARSYYDQIKPPYLNPPLKRYDMIFGERFIDWTSTVVLVEGVFDSIVIPNAVPLLGCDFKSYTKLKKKILDNDTSIILCLDEDARSNSIKIYNEIQSLGINTKVVLSSDYGDMNSLYCNGGLPTVMKLLASAKTLSKTEILMEML